MTLPEYPLTLQNDDTFRVTYAITGEAADLQVRAEGICYEQTVEFPADLTPQNIRDAIVGKIEALESLSETRHRATIAYPAAVAGSELTQLLNAIFGNTSIQPNVRVEHINLSQSLLAQYRGPRFGVTGLRALLDVPHRPLLCTALKPMGYPTEALAWLAKQFALGGIDIIKDDHGLADQSFSRYKARLHACAEAVCDANAQTGENSIYVPNITAPFDQLVDRAFAAKAAGAGGLMVAPGLIGFDAMRRLADDDDLALPIFSHPALLGSFTAAPENGISHEVLYGQITRLAGADSVIFPSWGGRFAFSQAECASIVRGTSEGMGGIKPIFPAPGGGMSVARVPEMLDVYGHNVVFLIGGGLHRHSDDLIKNSRHFRNIVENLL